MNFTFQVFQTVSPDNKVANCLICELSHSFWKTKKKGVKTFHFVFLFCLYWNKKATLKKKNLK